MRQIWQIRHPLIIRSGNELPRNKSKNFFKHRLHNGSDYNLSLLNLINFRLSRLVSTDPKTN